jgi:SanA protein
VLIWSLIAGVLLAIAGVIGALAIHHRVSSAGQGRIFSLEDEVPKHKVGLVLGALVFPNGRLSKMLQDRVDAGIDLYKRGVVEKLLMSGDNRTAHYNEVTAMRNYAIEHGVPSDDVVRDFAGFRTYDSIYRAKELWGLNDMIIISQKFHLPRSLFIAQKLGIDAIGVYAVDNPYRALARAELREKAARVVAWIDVLAGRDPYFLGQKETLSGDAQRTLVPEH